MKLVKIFVIAVIAFSSLAGCQEKKNDQPQQDQDSIEIVVTYHEDGSIFMETPYVNGVRNGTAKAYFEDGTLASITEYKNNKKVGVFKAYYPDGTLKYTAHYKDGLIDGEAIRYYPDGKIEAKQKYIRNKLVYDKKYTAEGKVEYEETYE